MYTSQVVLHRFETDGLYGPFVCRHLFVQREQLNMLGTSVAEAVDPAAPNEVAAIPMMSAARVPFRISIHLLSRIWRRCRGDQAPRHPRCSQLRWTVSPVARWPSIFAASERISDRIPEIRLDSSCASLAESVSARIASRFLISSVRHDIFITSFLLLIAMEAELYLVRSPAVLTPSELRAPASPVPGIR